MALCDAAPTSKALSFKGPPAPVSAAPAAAGAAAVELLAAGEGVAGSAAAVEEVALRCGACAAAVVVEVDCLGTAGVEGVLDVEAWAGCLG